MSVPRVFISSTFYDLRHVRTAIKEFFESLGFEAVLSENFDVFYEHGQSAQMSCLEEINKCDMYVLVIGTRYGSVFPNDTLSITHREYREAIQVKLPIFAFVDKYAYDDYKVFCKNRNNPHVDASKIQYFSVREPQVFEFISEVESRTTDNALICFDQIAEIVDCLRKQVARMFKEKATKPSVEKEEPAKPAVDKAIFQSLLDNLSIVGIPSTGISESDIQGNDNLMELLVSKANSVDDLGADFRISMAGSVTNIGKDIMNLLSEQYRQVRGGS